MNAAAVDGRKSGVESPSAPSLPPSLVVAVEK